jgi:hypothetical protein
MMTRNLAPLADHASSTPGKDGLNLLDSCKICVIGSSNRVSFANLMTPSKGYVLSCVFCRNVNSRLVCDRQAPQSHEEERRPLYSNCSGTGGEVKVDLTVELSAAAVAVWAWHFIPHACAPAKC